MKIVDYVKETRTELSHVSWPTRKQAVAFTAIVIGISIAIAIYLGAADFLLSRIVKLLVS
ncbi:MAG TPA: preprotein translocase subunit SecE [Candidatus Paceibacterota bacterium]